MRTTNRIRAAATLVWLGVALANHARAEVRIADRRLSLQTERLPLRELITTLERSGLARIEVHGDMSGITVSDSFEGTDVAQALRRVLSAHSHVLIDHGPRDHGQRSIELILLSSPAGKLSGPAPESDRLPNAIPSSAEQGLAQQLPDRDAQAARRALEAHKITTEAVPADASAQVASNDPGVERRVQPIEAVAERAGRKARVPLRRAQQ